MKDLERIKEEQKSDSEKYDNLTRLDEYLLMKVIHWHNILAHNFENIEFPSTFALDII